MNYGMIRYTLGWLLLFEACFFTIPLVCGIVYWESATWSFLISMLICAVAGASLIVKKPKQKKLYAKDGMVIVALSWIVISLFGSLPFIISGAIPSFVDALFETVSGFTTTGASILSEVESLPKCMLLWRSFTHWIGGMGVLVFIMAFLPLGGAQNLHIMRAESTGPSVSKLVPRMRTTALILYIIYFGLTLIQFILLLAGNMSVFDALNTAFSTAGTGGFGFRNDSFASYSSYLQIVVTVFMLLFSVNFSVYYLALKFRWREVFNAELRAFLLIVLLAITIITLNVSSMFDSVGEAVRHVSFTVASLISTTGFSTVDFNLWPTLSKVMLLIIMVTGACAGSTAGGVKISRIVILLKGMGRQLKAAVHPRQYKKIQLDSQPVESEVVRGVNAYMVCYIVILAVSTFLISFENLDFTSTFTAVIATLGNAGPGLELVGPTANYGFLSSFSKLVLIFNMLAGRLELIPMLILFTPATWKKA